MEIDAAGHLYQCRRWLHRARPAGLGLVFWVLLPVIAFYALWVGGAQVLNNSNKVPGIPGSFQATGHSCKQQLCITSGTFSSDDQQLVVPDLMGDYRWPLGSTSRAVYNATTGEITGVAEDWDPAPTIIGMLASVTLLVIWGFCYLQTRRAQRLTHPVGPDPVAAPVVLPVTSGAVVTS